MTVIGLNDAFEATGDKKYLKMALEITEAIENNLIDDKLNIKDLYQYLMRKFNSWKIIVI